MRKLLLFFPLLLVAQAPPLPPNNNFYGVYTSGVTALLNTTIQPTDTTAFINNSSCTQFGVATNCLTAFTSNMLIQLSNTDIAQICSINAGPGNTTQLNFGHSSCPNIDGRNVGGSTAIVHFTNSPISSNFTSYSYNAILSQLNTIPPVSTIYPEIYGANAINLDNSTALVNSLLAACGTGVSTQVYFSSLYRHTRALSINCNDVSLVGQNISAGITYTGTGNVTCQLSITGIRNKLDTLSVLGNSHVINGICPTAAHRGAYRNLKLGNYTGTCFLTSFFVGNVIDNVACSNVELNGFTVVPTNGLVLDGIATANVINNFRADGLSNANVYLGNASTNTFIGGLWEGSKYGIFTTNLATINHFVGSDIECNGTLALSPAYNGYIQGSWNAFEIKLSGDGGQTACDHNSSFVIHSGQGNQILTGEFSGIQVDVAAMSTTIEGTAVLPSTDGMIPKLLDNSTTTTLKHVVDISNSGALLPDYQPNNLNINTKTDTGAGLHVDSKAVQVTGITSSPSSGKGPYISFDGSNGGINCYDFTMGVFCQIGINMPVFGNVPTIAGGGGLTLCIDTSGTIYKKSSCP